MSDRPEPIRLGINTIIGIVSSIAIQALGWYGTKVLFLHVAPATSDQVGLGLLGIATFFVMLASVVTGIGGFRIGTAYTFFVARGAAIKPLTGAYVAFNTISFTLLSLVIAGAVLWLNLFPGYSLALILLVVVFPIMHVPEFTYVTQRIAEGRAALSQLPVILETAVRTVFIVYFASAYSPISVASPLGNTLVTQIAIAYILGSFAGMVVSLPILRNLTIKGFISTVKDLFTYAYPIMGAMLMTFSVTILTPVIIMGLSTSADLQVFANVNAFLILLLFIPNAVILPLFPTLARMHAEGKMQELKFHVYKSIRYSIMLLAPGILACAVFRVVLLRDFYSSVLVNPGAWAMFVIVFVSLPMTLFQITGTTLDAVGLQKRELYVSAVQLATLVGLLFILVPRFFVLGGVLAMLFSSIAGLSINAWFLHRYLPISIPWRSIATVLLSSIATFALFSNTFTGYLGIHLPVQKVPVLVGVVLLGVAIYGLVLMAIGELSKEDVEELAGTAGLPEVVGKTLSRLCWRRTSNGYSGQE